MGCSTLKGTGRASSRGHGGKCSLEPILEIAPVLGLKCEGIPTPGTCHQELLGRILRSLVRWLCRENFANHSLKVKQNEHMGV